MTSENRITCQLCYGQNGTHQEGCAMPEAIPSNEVFDLPPAIYGSGYVGMTRLKYETLQRRLNQREEQIDGYERQLGIIDADASRTIGSEIERLQAALKDTMRVISSGHKHDCACVYCDGSAWPEVKR